MSTKQTSPQARDTAARIEAYLRERSTKIKDGWPTNDEDTSAEIARIIDDTFAQQEQRPKLGENLGLQAEKERYPTEPRPSAALTEQIKKLKQALGPRGRRDCSMCNGSGVAPYGWEKCPCRKELGL